MAGQPGAGAKDARRELERFHALINSPRWVPEQCYRMSSGTYALIGYVNQVTGLYLSKNYAVVPVFLQRALRQLEQVRDERVSEPYRKLVVQYLSHVAHFLADHGCLGEDEEHLRTLIPEALLKVEPDPAPEDPGAAAASSIDAFGPSGLRAL